MSATELALRMAAVAASRGAAHRRLLILFYHRVLDRPDPMLPGCIDRSVFAKHLQVLAEHFCVLPLARAVRLLAAGSLPSRAVSITFDDGYANNCTVAMPLLKERGLGATFFVATGFLDGGRMWNDTIIEAVRRASGEVLNLERLGMGSFPILSPQQRVQAIDALIGRIRQLPLQERAHCVQGLAEHVGAELPRDLMLSSQQLAALQAAGMEIGAHTVDHPILTRMPHELAEKQIRDSRGRLRELLGEDVSGFAYPNGKPGTDYAREHVEGVRRAGFSYAVSTQRGCARRGFDLMQLPRFSPWDRSPRRFRLRMIWEFAAARDQVVV